MSEIYDPDKELTHDDYIGFGLKRFAQLMNCDDINQYCKKHADDGAEVKWDEGAANYITLAGVSSKPDFTYEDNERLWVGEAKANLNLANPEFNNKNAPALYTLMSSVNAGANQNKILDKFVKGEYNDTAVLNDDLKAAKNGDIDDYNNVRTTMTNFAKPTTDKLRAVSLNGYTAEQLIAKHYTEDSIDEMLEQNDALHDVTGAKHDELINAKRKLHEYEERRNPSLFTGIDD